MRCFFVNQFTAQCRYVFVADRFTTKLRSKIAVDAILNNDNEFEIAKVRFTQALSVSMALT